MKFPVSGMWDARAAQSGGLLRIIRLAAALVMGGALAACTVVKMAYNQAPELAYLQLDGYFDFNDTQAGRVREELTQVQHWHRRTQLPAYSEFLQKWQGRVAGELSAAQVCEAVAETRSRLLLISERMQPVAAELVPTLAPQQLKHLQAKFAKLNRDYTRDFISGSPAARLDKRVDQAVTRAERLYGTLEEKQKELLRRRMVQSAFDAQLALAEYQRRQQDALQTLAPLISGAASPEQARPAIRDYLQRSVTSPNPAYRNYQAQFQHDNCTTLALLHNSTTPAQRARAARTLGNYARDFTVLAAQASDAARSAGPTLGLGT